MHRICIATVDASRARLFTLDRSAESTGIYEELIEQRDLVNPARRLRPSELFTETRRSSGRIGTLHYGTDDHRDEHIDALDVEFARAVIAELRSLLESSGARRLILCASPRMLGTLRETGAELRRDRSLSIDEAPRDLVKLTPTQLRDQLASYALLPPRPARPAISRQA